MTLPYYPIETLTYQIFPRSLNSRWRKNQSIHEDAIRKKSHADGRSYSPHIRISLKLC
jgi:hypothetical protein